MILLQATEKRKHFELIINERDNYIVAHPMFRLDGHGPP